jgi:hypothetical protein
MAENKWLDRDLSYIEAHETDVGILSVAAKSDEQEDEQEEEHVTHDTEVAEAAFKLEAPDFDDPFPSTSDSEDRKLAAGEESKHSLDDLVENDEETKRSLEDLEHGRLDTHLFSLDDGEDPPTKRARTFHPRIAHISSHDHANQFHMSMNFPPYASPVSHSAPYQHQLHYEYPAYASLPPTYASSPPAGYPNSHHYPHLMDHQMAPPHHMHHHMAHYSHPGAPGYASSSPIRTVNTASGENSRELPFRGPSVDELEAARTARARSALHTWYQRLEELFEYKQANGNCKQSFPR